MVNDQNKQPLWDIWVNIAGKLVPIQWDTNVHTRASESQQLLALLPISNHSETSWWCETVHSNFFFQKQIIILFCFFFLEYEQWNLSNHFLIKFISCCHFKNGTLSICPGKMLTHFQPSSPNKTTHLIDTVLYKHSHWTMRFGKFAMECCCFLKWWIQVTRKVMMQGLYVVIKQKHKAK